MELTERYFEEEFERITHIIKRIEEYNPKENTKRYSFAIQKKILELINDATDPLDNRKDKRLILLTKAEALINMFADLLEYVKNENEYRKTSSPEIITEENKLSYKRVNDTLAKLIFVKDTLEEEIYREQCEIMLHYAPSNKALEKSIRETDTFIELYISEMKTVGNC
jgi:hypothetical protein